MRMKLSALANLRYGAEGFSFQGSQLPDLGTRDPGQGTDSRGELTGSLNPLGSYASLGADNEGKLCK